MGSSSGDSAEDRAAADKEVDRLIRTLPPKDMSQLLQSQPIDPMSDDSLGSTMDGGNLTGIIARTPDKVPDKNHNTKRPIPAEDDSEDESDSDDDYFGV